MNTPALALRYFAPGAVIAHRTHRYVLTDPSRDPGDGLRAVLSPVVPLDIGVTGDNDEPLYLKKHRVKTGESTYTIEVAKKPVKAGIDPVVKLVDRRSDDNTVAVN